MSETLWHTKSGDEVITEFDTPLGVFIQEAEIRLENMVKINSESLKRPLHSSDSFHNTTIH